jgi:hypothetical protein
MGVMGMELELVVLLFVIVFVVIVAYRVISHIVIVRLEELSLKIEASFCFIVLNGQSNCICIVFIAELLLLSY